MKLIHYQTFEQVSASDLAQLQKFKGRFNEDRKFWDKIKLWRKSEILENAEPTGARWGFTKATTDEERKAVIEAIKEMSRLTPSLTWVVYDETDGKETTYKGGVKA